MSRIGKRPIPVPANVEVTIDGQHVRVKGPKGELERTIHRDVILERQDNEVLVKRPSDDAHHRALHGLSRTLIA
ncbi:MAG TPA: 50S ribosomal protein L6, partial [Longimicrobiaceae bacterium]|nr:50S ribosomal protein L6 [Longimicrobiaceae bacterium]